MTRRGANSVKRRLWRTWASAAFSGCLLLTCLRHEARAAESLHHVRLVYFWPVQGFLLIPIVVAQEQGIYRKYGLDVSIVLPPDAQTTARMLATGQAEIGMEARTDVVFAAEVSLPLISIANYDRSARFLDLKLQTALAGMTHNIRRHQSIMEEKLTALRVSIRYIIQNSCIKRI